jgi:hypothetical protein
LGSRRKKRKKNSGSEGEKEEKNAGNWIDNGITITYGTDK